MQIQSVIAVTIDKFSDFPVFSKDFFFTFIKPSSRALKCFRDADFLGMLQVDSLPRPV